MAQFFIQKIIFIPCTIKPHSDQKVKPDSSLDGNQQGRLISPYLACINFFLYKSGEWQQITNFDWKQIYIEEKSGLNVFLFCLWFRLMQFFTVLQIKVIQKTLTEVSSQVACYHEVRKSPHYIFMYHSSISTAAFQDGMLEIVFSHSDVLRMNGKTTCLKHVRGKKLYETKIVIFFPACVSPKPSF